MLIWIGQDIIEILHYKQSNSFTDKINMNATQSKYILLKLTVTPEFSGSLFFVIVLEAQALFGYWQIRFCYPLSWMSWLAFQSLGCTYRAFCFIKSTLMINVFERMKH